VGRQLELELATWGGKRANAGRRARPGREGFVPHVTRPRHATAHPAHVTMRARRLLPTLRGEALLLAIRRSIRRAHREFFRVLHFSVQRDHVHLVIEATDRQLLWRGVQGLAIRIARALNRALGRRGSVWADRYHRRDLKTPREVRNALVYVLMNHRKHDRTSVFEPALDACSSALWFDGWSVRAGPLVVDLLALEVARDRRAPIRPPVAQAQTWLARRGWHRHGFVEPNERPRG
jgi:putative transposase